MHCGEPVQVLQTAVLPSPPLQRCALPGCPFLISRFPWRHASFRGSSLEEGRPRFPPSLIILLFYQLSCGVIAADFVGGWCRFDNRWHSSVDVRGHGRHRRPFLLLLLQPFPFRVHLRACSQVRFGEVTKSHQTESLRDSTLLGVGTLIVFRIGFGNISPENFVTEARLCGTRRQECII